MAAQARRPGSTNNACYKVRIERLQAAFLLPYEGGRYRFIAGLREKEL